jgi:peptidoglycan DL-endopeptidase CwlO
MRIAVPWLLALALAAGLASSARADSPALRAKRAQAEAVLKRVDALGVRFGRVVDAWDGAQIQLARTKKQLAANERELARARRQNRIAEQRLAAVLVALYEHGTPTLPEIVLGSSSMSDLIDHIEAAHTVDAYDKRVAAEAKRWETTLAATRLELRRVERTRRETVAQLSHERSRIGAMLAQRKRMLASVQSEVSVLQAQEAARQRALLAAARARLAREQAAREAAAREAAARAAATPPPAAAAAATAATTATTTTTDATTGTDPAAATTTTTPAPAPAPSLGPGYPQAAAIALKYLGIPYQWGGASPATGFDCSGLVMYVYAQLGVSLPHQAAAQYGYGVAVPRSELQPGDLVFYDGLSHVAIYIGNGEVVHAPQTGDVVKIAPLSGAGGSYVGARRL